MYLDRGSRRTEIYGLNTLMKRQTLPLREWSMVACEANRSRDVPALKPQCAKSGSYNCGSGRWGGRCGRGDCAMVVTYD